MTIQRETNHRVTCDHVYRWVAPDENAPRFADMDPNAEVRERPCEANHLHRGDDLEQAVAAYELTGWRSLGESWFCPEHAPADDKADALKGYPLQGFAAGLFRAADSQR